MLNPHKIKNAYKLLTLASNRNLKNNIKRKEILDDILNVNSNITLDHIHLPYDLVYDMATQNVIRQDNGKSLGTMSRSIALYFLYHQSIEEAETLDDEIEYLKSKEFDKRLVDFNINVMLDSLEKYEQAIEFLKEANDDDYFCWRAEIMKYGLWFKDSKLATFVKTKFT